MTDEAAIKKIEASASELVKPGKNFTVRLPRVSFFYFSGASARFLMELQETIGAAGEMY